MEMTKEQLREMSKDEVMEFIRDRLKMEKGVSQSVKCLELRSDENDHYRFDMSGYENKTGECTIYNLSVLNKFADLGIYDYTTYLFLDFYKGTATLYFQYFYGSEDRSHQVVDLTGKGTRQIIYSIFELTIFSGQGSRRRI